MTTHLQAKPAGMPTWTDLSISLTGADAARAFYGALFGWEYDIGGAEFNYYTTARIGARLTAGIAVLPPEMPLPSAWGGRRTIWTPTSRARLSSARPCNSLPCISRVLAAWRRL
jgi:predicted enzyme related to lactoylglutathione lyase